MGIGGVINRPKGQANSPSPFFYLLAAITGKLKNAGGFQWEYKKMTIFVSQ